MQNYPSRTIEKAVEALSTFPGIGKKTALRMVLHLLKLPEHEVTSLADSVRKLKTDIRYCSRCANISDDHLCEVCANPLRDHHQVCVVEDIRDVMAIENTGQFRGVYHLLGGLISPIDGVGPGDLNIDRLIERVSNDQVKELIMALSANMEGDTTTFYITRKLQESNLPVQVTTIARGIAVGGELEYADEITLGRSIVNRIPFKV